MLVRHRPSSSGGAAAAVAVATAACSRNSIDAHMHTHLTRSAACFQVKTLYRQSLKNALNWYVRRDLWREKVSLAQGRAGLAGGGTATMAIGQLTDP